MDEIITWLPAELATLPRYVVALAIGLLMWLERERNPAAKAGLRTFALTALFSVLATHLATELNALWLVAVGLLLVGAMMIAAYLRAPQQPDGDPGTTTVAALMLCYGLDVLGWHDEIQLAVMLGIAATMLLYFKPQLRGFSQRVSRHDLLSMLQFAVLALIVLPLLPNRDYGPYGALNPHQIWWMVVLIAGVGLAGYAALRRVGQQRGAVVLGLLGGLVSSTATTLSFSRHARASSAMMVSGLTDVDAITLSSLRLYNLDTLSVTVVVNVITLANLAFKSVLTLSIGGWQMARHAIAGMGAMGLGLVVTWAIIRGFSA